MFPQPRTRRPHLRTLAALGLALLVVSSTLAALTVATERPAAAASASLRVSPTNFVGGQRLTWSGNIGATGERTLVLQFNMGSVVRNTWDTVEGFSARTRADGSFSFSYPAPSMFNIAYRVKAGSHVTPARIFNAKTQDLTLRVTGQRENNTNQPGRVGVGETFGITADTTPDTIFRQPDSIGLPVFRGRTLTLQKRITGSRWRTVATTTVGADGLGHFSGLRARAGTAVYRVRQENHFTGGNRIGWTQSFPLYVLVGDAAQSSYTRRYGNNEPGSFEPSRSKVLPAQPSTSSQRYSWFPSVFDFAWEHGQSLDSAPARGTRIQGRWIPFSNGSGRAAKYNGGLALDSKRYVGAGAGDFGTTRATLVGNALTYGRWEASLRIRNAFERTGRPYDIVAELIPARGADYDCGRHNITVASISPYSQRVRFGIRSPRFRWGGAVTAAHTPLANAYNVAVEVADDHITWFLNGAPVGSVTDPHALQGVPLSLRLSLVGSGRAEMDQVGLISDWQRGFPIHTGQQSVSAKKLQRRNAAPIACP